MGWKLGTMEFHESLQAQLQKSKPKITVNLHVALNLQKDLVSLGNEPRNNF